MTLLFIIYWLALLVSSFVLGVLIGAIFYKPLREKVVEIARAIGRRDLSLSRIIYNPVMRPGTHPWTAEAVMNPAAIILNGRTHLVYRSVGMDGVSRMGYASSADGLLFDEQLPYPIYVSRKPSKLSASVRRYSPVLYPSGGSWGGCEDPRIVDIDNHVYITFNMFDGWDFIRTAVISLSTDDFINKRFDRWRGPQILSPDGERHKNWILFPEKIHDKFALLHSLFGDADDAVRIEFIDDIEAFKASPGFISPDPLAMPNNRIGWHDRMRSAGPPPLKTKNGWLVFYHAMQAAEPNRYKMGVMLLDLKDPTKILYRSAHPILEPDEWYENEGKPGIVYACGATIRDGMLYVYYGGADKVICAAFAPLEAFLKALMSDEHVALTTKPLITT